LQIQSQDVFGRPVSFGDFPVMDIDFDYVPTIQHDIVAIGYPRIWSETISETKWVIAWTVQKNDFTYIKFDALIAGWNSWWPLIHDWKLVWVNTYGVGWWTNDRLSYALSIQEAQDFIQKNTPSWQATISKKEKKQQNYFRELYRINESTTIQDDIFSLSFAPWYSILDYEPNTYIRGKILQQKDYSIQSFSLQVLHTPELTSQSDTIFYASKILWLYATEYQKLVKKEINGTVWYEITYKNDVTQWASSQNKTYISQITPHALVMMSVQAPTADETVYQEVSDEIELFLKWVSLRPETAISLPKQTSMLLPSIPLFIQDDAWIYNPSFGSVMRVEPNLHEFIEMYAVKNTLVQGKQQDIDTVFTIVTQDIPSADKMRFRINGHEWFLFCESQDVYTQTKQGADIIVQDCTARLYITKAKNKENEEQAVDDILLIRLRSEPQHKQKTIEQAQRILTSSLRLSTAWDGETTSFGFENQTTPLLFDTQRQTAWFASLLQNLVRYEIVPNTADFSLEKALTRWEFLPWYLHTIYWFAWDSLTQKVTQILSQSHIVIDANAYVNTDMLDYFADFVQLELAWATLPDYSEKMLYLYSIHKDEQQFAEQKRLVDSFLYSVYGNKKIDLDETGMQHGRFTSTQSALFFKHQWLVQETLYSQDMNFGANVPQTNRHKDYDALDTCLQQNIQSTEQCFVLYKWVIARYLAYPVLTRWKAIDYVKRDIDFGLFDPAYAKRKDTIVE